MDQLLKTCNGLQTMRFKTNHHIGLMAQNLETMTLRVMVMYLLMMLYVKVSTFLPLKLGNKLKISRKRCTKKFASKVGLDYSGKIGPSEVLGGSSSEFSPTQLASAFANCSTYNNAHSIQKVVTHDGDTIEYDHSSHSDERKAYMLAEILKGTFKAYGSAYGHGFWS